MKLPWVAREALEFLQEQLRECKAEHAVAIAVERQRYDTLFAAYEKLRIEKLANPAVYPTDEQIRQVEERYEDLGMEVEMAIADVAQGDTSLERQLWEEARRMLARGNAPAEVAERIMNGATNDD